MSSTKPGLLLVVLCSALAAALWPSFAALHGFWTDTDNRSGTHGYLVLGVCAWLVFRARHDFAARADRPDRRWLLPLALASLAWAVSYRGGLQDLHLLLLPLLFWLAVAAAFGFAAARTLAMPIGFLVFALPLWSSGNALLQAITVKVVGVLIWMTGLSAYVQGNYVQVPAGTFEIAGGCSGLHFFVVGLAVGALYGELGNDRPRTRLEWLALAAVLSLVANWVRVFTIILAGYYTDMQHYLVRVDHYTFGWFVFAGALAVFFFVAQRRARRLEQAEAGPEDPTLPQEEWPVITTRLPSPAAPAGLALGVLLAVAVAAALPLRARAAGAAAVDEPRLAWPGALAATGPQGHWRPVYPGATALGQHSFRDQDGLTLEVFQAAFARQRQGAELVGGDTLPLGSPEAFVEQERTVRAGSGRWREMTVRGPGQSLALLRARWIIGERAFVWPLGSQLWYGLASLAGPVPSRVVLVHSICKDDCERARAAMEIADAWFTGAAGRPDHES